MLRFSLAKLLDYFLTPKTPFSRLGHTKFNDRLGWNLDLLLRLWIKTRCALSFSASRACQNRARQFHVLLNLFVGDVAERIEKYSSDSFVGLGGFGKCTLEFGLGHFVAVGYARNRRPASPKFFETSK